MIYEMRTYTLKPGNLARFEDMIAKWMPSRDKYSNLGAFWHTEFGPLNQVIHVWPYEDLNERARIRTEVPKDPGTPALPGDIILDMESEILIAAPFMRPMGEQRLGNVYEMRIYTYIPGSMQEVLKRWGEVIPYREQYSPLAACWYSELGTLNRLFHVWPYKDLAERDRIRAEVSKDPHWPPQTPEILLYMENKLLIPAPFSPMR